MLRSALRVALLRQLEVAVPNRELIVVHLRGANGERVVPVSAHHLDGETNPKPSQPASSTA